MHYISFRDTISDNVSRKTIGNDICYYCERDLEEIGLLKSFTIFASE